LDIWTSCITIWHQIMVKVMFTSLPVPFFRELIFKTNLMKNQEKPFRIWNKLLLVRAQAQLHKKMLTLNVTNRIIMKITVWLIPTRQRFDNCLLKKFNYRHVLAVPAPTLITNSMNCTIMTYFALWNFKHSEISDEIP
jgi:hypothetical protein